MVWKWLNIPDIPVLGVFARCFKMFWSVSDVVLLGQDGLSDPSTSHSSGCLQEDRPSTSLGGDRLYFVHLGWEGTRREVYSMWFMIYDDLWCDVLLFETILVNYISELLLVNYIYDVMYYYLLEFEVLKLFFCELLFWWHGRFPAIFMMIFLCWKLGIVWIQV